MVRNAGGVNLDFIANFTNAVNEASLQQGVGFDLIKIDGAGERDDAVLDGGLDILEVRGAKRFLNGCVGRAVALRKGCWQSKSRGKNLKVGPFHGDRSSQNISRSSAARFGVLKPHSYVLISPASLKLLYILPPAKFELISLPPTIDC